MRHAARIFFILFVSVALWLVMVFVEADQILNNVVSPPPEVQIEDWINRFKGLGTFVLGAALLAALLWYVLGQWALDVSRWRDSQKRWVWLLLLFFLPILSFVAAIVSLRQAQEGAPLAYIFLVANAIVCYYIGTLFSSPSAFKYTPLGARKIRPSWT
ncbi:MAG TPA: hypothetical protein VJX67_23555 [Blastocatellia bacterium]|nr:hypothetical protein [Blastocatellia bacterium]